MSGVPWHSAISLHPLNSVQIRTGCPPTPNTQAVLLFRRGESDRGLGLCSSSKAFPARWLSSRHHRTSPGDKREPVKQKAEDGEDDEPLAEIGEGSATPRENTGAWCGNLAASITAAASREAHLSAAQRARTATQKNSCLKSVALAANSRT
ncbi:hypothetical protein AAFF_G00199420 [Aldrovandia affinis]|uniref:Uncharacterized protein n=1 Tax=Aldrovandia affinis TaxID=143900 RepID=A0AAD7RI89_9TELE|nr:hypothetical protein AAFF_G00199420 [Aldrovandia affinis]